MKAFYLLLAMVPLTLAAARYAPPPPPCECAQVKCPGEQPAVRNVFIRGSFPIANHNDLFTSYVNALTVQLSPAPGNAEVNQL